MFSRMATRVGKSICLNFGTRPIQGFDIDSPWCKRAYIRQRIFARSVPFLTPIALLSRSLPLSLHDSVIFFREPRFVGRRDLNYRAPRCEEHGHLAMALFPPALSVRGKFRAHVRKAKSRASASDIARGKLRFVLRLYFSCTARTLCAATLCHEFPSNGGLGRYAQGASNFSRNSDSAILIERLRTILAMIFKPLSGASIIRRIRRRRINRNS